MSDNYPPGVTGREYAIAGPDWEEEFWRVCGNKNATVRTISEYGKRLLEQAVAHLKMSVYDPNKASMMLQMAIGDIQEADLAEECPFEGEVIVQAFEGVLSWECPVCREQHEDDLRDDAD